MEKEKKKKKKEKNLKMLESRRCLREWWCLGFKRAFDNYGFTWLMSSMSRKLVNEMLPGLENNRKDVVCDRVYECLGNLEGEK